MEGWVRLLVLGHGGFEGAIVGPPLFNVNKSNPIARDFVKDSTWCHA